LGITAFVFSIYFGRQVYSQALIAEEYVQLPINCEANSLVDCNKLDNDRELLLKIWGGSLKNDFIFFILLWGVHGASLIYTKKNHSRTVI